MVKSNKVVDSITCQNGSAAEWDYSNNWLVFKTVKAPDYCTLDFKDGYTVTVNATNGTVTAPVSKSVGNGGSLSFTVTPNDGYVYESNTCGGTYSGNTYTVNNITNTKTCNITFKQKGPTLADLIQTNAVNENGYRYEGADPNNYIQMQKTDGTTEMWRIIGLFSDGENGEDVIRVRGGYVESAYDTSGKNHWPKSSLYTSFKNVYSTSNYKNTVNYKVYLGGTGNDSISYTTNDYYNMERLLNNKGSVGSSAKSYYNSETVSVANVGFIYPSDYGYGVLASDCARETELYMYSEPDNNKCHINNWLYQGSSKYQWLISPDAYYDDYSFWLSNYGYVSNNAKNSSGVTSSYLVSPVMALSADVKVTGSGTQTDPYVMQ